MSIIMAFAMVPVAVLPQNQNLSLFGGISSKYRMTSEVDCLLTGLLHEVESAIGNYPCLRSLLLRYCELFQLNSMEVAGWAWVLGRSLRSVDAQERHVTNMGMAAYHIKVKLSPRIEVFTSMLALWDSNFLVNYGYWLHSHPALHQITMEELNRSYTRLMMYSAASNRVTTYTGIVEDLVGVMESSEKGEERHEIGCMDEDDLAYQIREIPDLSSLFHKNISETDFEDGDKAYHSHIEDIFDAPDSVFFRQ